MSTYTMSPLEAAKAALPLPQLMERLGLGQHAKKSARCPFHEDRSNSFSIFECENGGWRWNCFAGCSPSGKPGDGADLIAKLENTSNADACRRYIELAGVPDGDRRKAPARQAAPELRREPTRVADMPAAISDAWREGVEYLQERPPISSRLAASRGWPIEFAQHLIVCGAVSMPLEKGKRDVAFQVVAPEGRRGAMVTRPIGYHVRVAGDAGKKYSWRYRPNEREDGHSIPSLPYVLGDFETAKLLVICEGQWDSLTFAFAAGWLGDGCLWPRGVGVIGIRGTTGTGVFLRHYRRFWPSNADCLLMPDGDDPGDQWHDGRKDCFANQLGTLYRRVAVVACDGWKDINDLYRAEGLTREDIGDLLAAHDMVVGNEVLV
ncbi:MAG: hypothetical protein H0U23_02405 [Blastocatellia bacterium]|nr:hypothetical protein [Blastocatellia bacterium]